MFTANMRESVEDHVELKAITGLGLESVVKFAYTGTLDVNLTTLEEILAAAVHLQASCVSITTTQNLVGVC